MLIFHIAEKSRWEAAQLAGSYAQSTLGRSLEQEGFIHACREDQWEDVLERHYASATSSLVLLCIDTEKLSSPWQEDQVGDTSYPHVYGPLNPAAVVDVRPVPTPAAQTPRGTRERTLMQEFVAELRFRMLAATAIMVVAAICGFAAIHFLGDRAGLPVLLGALVAGTGVAWWFSHRRDKTRASAES